ncbi:hypothetical protein [Streptomyces sp. NPDC057545]|uniref:hypothetical protein n=1 Tax=Streptomyces sp. NPDC057545 TaxID=3346164 RepID=UPI00368E4946
MWPGQQPPGGEHNPQDQNPNPYQQPGYQQPNPYQQPGYQQQGQPGQHPGHPQQGQQPGYGYPQPTPYQQPTVPQYAVPGPPGTPQPGNDKKKTTAVAIVAATAVVVAAAVTGVVVLNKDDDKDKDVADDKKTSAPADPSESAASPEANPRGGDDAKPLVAGWKVVTNPKWGTRFDVPGDWEVGAPGTFSFFEDEKKGDHSPLIGFTGPSYLQKKWCVDDSDKNGVEETSSLASAGSRGAQGATDAAKNAHSEAGTWAWGAFAQHMPQSTIKFTPARQYTTKSGLTGQVVTATAPGVTKRQKCDSDGKTIAFTFKNKNGEFASWVLYAAANVPDELPDTTIEKILSTVRLTDVAPSS